MSAPRPKVGISHCLLGEACRYDGRDAHAEGLVRVLGPQVEWVPVCPERAIGLPVPREKLLLVGPAEAPALLGEGSGHDRGPALRAFAQAFLEAPEQEDLSGFVLKSRSPSCGIGDVWRRPSLGEPPRRDGTGLFARTLLSVRPGLPVRQETELHTEVACERFLREVRARQARASGEEGEHGSEA
jgi:uncharacterized protein YbbK (DUF523 family)